ncbi:hypothetical protein VP01_7854g1, partial [Puccinia sorghi]
LAIYILNLDHYSIILHDYEWLVPSDDKRPLELAEAIVEELNKLATLGCVAHDFSLKEDVLFMKIPLCFISDSLMSAEVTNTPHPGASKKPCRTSEFDKKQQLYGLRDRINFEIIGLENKRDERIYNPFLKLKEFDGTCGEARWRSKVEKQGGGGLSIKIESTFCQFNPNTLLLITTALLKNNLQFYCRRPHLYIFAAAVMPRMEFFLATQGDEKFVEGVG